MAGLLDTMASELFKLGWGKPNFIPASFVGEESSAVKKDAAAVAAAAERTVRQKSGDGISEVTILLLDRFAPS